MMFGRQMHNLEARKPKRGIKASDEIAIFQRATEIRKLHDIIMPEKLAESKTQKQQRKTQDTRANPTDKHLENGATVYIRSMQIQNKLKPDAHGPYTVNG
jgi:hypothetical protein